MTVYVNQYTGDILGIRSGPTWLNQVHQFHLRLLAGATGKTIVSWAGLLMTLLTLSGLYLWWPIKRVFVNWAAGGRRVWFDLHNAVGIFSWVFLFLLGLTGAVIGFESVTTPFLYRVTGSQPFQGSLTIEPVPGGRTLTPVLLHGGLVVGLRGRVPGRSGREPHGVETRRGRCGRWRGGRLRGRGAGAEKGCQSKSSSHGIHFTA